MQDASTVLSVSTVMLITWRRARGVDEVFIPVWSQGRPIKTCKLDEIGTRQGGSALFQRVPLPITSRTDSTRVREMINSFTISLEGGDIGGYRTQGLVCHRTDNEHTTERRKDRNRGEAPHYCGRARSFGGEFCNESGETLRPRTNDPFMKVKKLIQYLI